MAESQSPRGFGAAGRVTALAASVMDLHVRIALQEVVREQASGWQLWLLSGNPKLTGGLRMKASRRIPISNGGIDCRWLHYGIR